MAYFLSGPVQELLKKARVRWRDSQQQNICENIQYFHSRPLSLSVIPQCKALRKRNKGNLELLSRDITQWLNENIAIGCSSEITTQNTPFDRYLELTNLVQTLILRHCNRDYELASIYKLASLTVAFLVQL
jgi:hypothetical protein